MCSTRTLTYVRGQTKSSERHRAGSTTLFIVGRVPRLKKMPAKIRSPLRGWGSCLRLTQGSVCCGRLHPGLFSTAPSGGERQTHSNCSPRAALARGDPAPVCPKSWVPHPFRVLCGMGGKPGCSIALVHEKTEGCMKPDIGMSRLSTGAALCRRRRAWRKTPVRVCIWDRTEAGAEVAWAAQAAACRLRGGGAS